MLYIILSWYIIYEFLEHPTAFNYVEQLWALLLLALFAWKHIFMVVCTMEKGNVTFYWIGIFRCHWKMVSNVRLACLYYHFTHTLTLTHRHTHKYKHFKQRAGKYSEAAGFSVLKSLSGFTVILLLCFWQYFTVPKMFTTCLRLFIIAY